MITAEEIKALKKDCTCSWDVAAQRRLMEAMPRVLDALEEKDAELARVRALGEEALVLAAARLDESRAEVPSPNTAALSASVSLPADYLSERFG